MFPGKVDDEMVTAKVSATNPSPQDTDTPPPLSFTEFCEKVDDAMFTDTTEEHREKLAGSDTEQVYLTSGTYHRLADMIRIGWHPRFRELMSKLVKAS